MSTYATFKLTTSKMSTNMTTPSNSEGETDKASSTQAVMINFLVINLLKAIADINRINYGGIIRYRRLMTLPILEINDSGDESNWSNRVYCVRCQSVIRNNVYAIALHEVECDSIKNDNTCCVNSFYCHACNLHFITKDGFKHHNHDHRMELYSYYCVFCCAMIYGPKSIISFHSGISHYPWASKRHKLPVLSVLMKKIIRRFEKNRYNSKDEIMFACVSCQNFSEVDPIAQDRLSSCMLCTDETKLFYCDSCNVSFSCTRFSFQMHTYSFEHMYIEKIRTNNLPSDN